MSKVKKFPQEQVETIMAEGKQVLELAVAFGWPRAEREAPVTLENCRNQAAALRRAVASPFDKTFKPTQEQKEALWPFLKDYGPVDADGMVKVYGLLRLCSSIAMLEAIKLPWPAKEWLELDDMYGPRQDAEELLEQLTGPTAKGH